MLKHIFLVNCMGKKEIDEKISSDKTAEISTWCRKFCPPKNFVRPKFCPTIFYPIRYLAGDLIFIDEFKDIQLGT